MLKRCLTLISHPFFVASQQGVGEDIPGHGSVLLVTRIVGLVDKPQERDMLGLMGDQCTFNCSQYMARRDESYPFRGEPSVPRPVISTREAQLRAKSARIENCRPCVRAEFACSASSLPFVPALGSVLGLGTGVARMYEIVSFETLHV